MGLPKSRDAEQLLLALEGFVSNFHFCDIRFLTPGGLWWELQSGLEQRSFKTIETNEN